LAESLTHFTSERELTALPNSRHSVKPTQNREFHENKVSEVGERIFEQVQNIA
jgi:hypothetical protein